MTDTLNRLTTALADRYRIERELGQGGMATVYLAQDLKHDRKVAIKVLKPELAAVLGADRFIVEIKTTAALQHPHILALFDSGTADGFLFYVMPYVQGETLRSKLDRETQVGIDEAVRITRDVADALDYAHRHGVVHRDIKPENILLHDGRPMVADFGIALAVSAAAGGRMTETGLSLGTPHYMSPEQATAEKEISGRSDVYSLASVLYEMLAGQPPHLGGSAQQIIMKIIASPVEPVTTYRKSVPMNVEAAVAQALEKLPADRFESAKAFADALGNTGFTIRHAAGLGSHAGRGAGGSLLLWRGVAAAAALLAIVTLGAMWLRPVQDGPVRRYAVTFPTGQRPLPRSSLALSPDGSQLLYSGPNQGDENGHRIWIKSADRMDGTPLPGTLDGDVPTFSPNGQWFAFWQGGRLMKLSASGGAAVPLADSVMRAGLAWLDSDEIVFTDATTRRLRRVPAGGGTADVVFTAVSGQILNPTPLPGGRGVLYLSCRDSSCADMAAWTLDLKRGESSLLSEGVRGAWYVPTGHVLLARGDGVVLAAPFSLRTLKMTGPAVPVLERVLVDMGRRTTLAVAQGGTLMLFSGNFSPVASEFVWIDRSGRVTPVDSGFTFQHANVGGNRGFALSPDGRRIAFGGTTEGRPAIWIKELPSGPLARLTFDSTLQLRPRWSTDGRSVHFLTGVHQNTFDVYQHRADGTGTDEPLAVTKLPVVDATWTRDGKTMILRIGGTPTRVERSIFTFRPGMDTAPVPLLADLTRDESAPALSPDGRWLAYESNENGVNEVYVRPFPNVDSGRWLVSNGGGQTPRWTPNGRELFYLNGSRELVAVAVGAGAEFTASERRVLFGLPVEVDYSAAEHYPLFDVAPAGQRFLFSRKVQGPDSEAPLLVVTDNWFTELRARVKP